MAFGLKHLNRTEDSSSSRIQTLCDFHEIAKTYLHVVPQ